MCVFDFDCMHGRQSQLGHVGTKAYLKRSVTVSHRPYHYSVAVVLQASQLASSKP